MNLFFEQPKPAKGEEGISRIMVDCGLLPDLMQAYDGGRPPRRVNIRALAIVSSILVLILALYFPIMARQEGRLRRAALAQARSFADDQKLDLALITLEHHLETWPDDVPALALQAGLLTDSARTPEEILKAAGVQDQLVRIDPMGQGRQDNRRRLVELYLRHGEWLRYATTKKELAVDRHQSRYRAAAKIARQRVLFGADDAESHRLVAMALEALGSMGDARSQSEASIEYEKALRRDPGDALAAERLATIDLERRANPAGGDEILDELLRARPDSAPVRLVRYRFFRRTRRDEKAVAELVAATRLAPSDPETRLAAAGDALRRNDAASARRHLAAVAEEHRGDPRLTVVQGQVDLVEQHPDGAIETWRKGLAAVGGRDRELTWQLASTLIRQGRLAEAGPLVGRFERLMGDGSDPMSSLLRGMLKERSGHTAAAIAELEPARGSFGADLNLELSVVLGRCYETLNDDARATIEYRRAVEAAPLSAYPRRAVARLLRKVDPEQAASELEAGLGVVTEPAPLLHDLAALRLDQQRANPPDRRSWKPFEEALGRLEQASPDDLDVPKLRAEFLMISGRTDEAFDLLARLTRGAARGREDFWLSWAAALAGRGRAVEALGVLDEASAREALGDHASIRAAKARILVGLGRARAARDLLGVGIEKIPAHERGGLARVRAEVLHGLGDHAGARAACGEWSRLSPGDPQPGLTLLSMARRGGGDEEARLGLELLRKVGGEGEPYALAARALDLLGSSRDREVTRSARLDQADRLIEDLQAIAPQLPVASFLRGVMLERNHRIEEAVVAYRIAIRGNATGMALPRLVALFNRLGRLDDLAELKESTGESLMIDQLSANASMEAGDKDRAQKLVSRLVESLPDSMEMRAAQVRLLGESGKPEEAVESLRSLARRRPDQPGPWLALVIVQLGQGWREEVARTIDQAQTSYKGERADVLIARCRWIAGDKEAAARLLEGALAARPTDLGTMKEGDEFFEATGRPDRAEAILRRALKVDPTSPWATRRLALLLSARPDLASWVEAWGLIAPGSPGAGDGPEDRLTRVDVLQRSPDPARRGEAAAALAALIEDLPAANPIAVDARVRLARAHLDAGRADEAARVIDPAAEASSVPPPATLALAVEALARSGHAEAAGRQLARLVAVEPNTPRAVACRAWVFTAAGKRADATATIEDALAESRGKPEEAAATVAYVNLLRKIGQPDAAEALARRVAGRRPVDAWLLAGFQATSGRAAEALASCRIAADAGAGREPVQVALGLMLTHKLDPTLKDQAGAVADVARARAPDDRVLIGMVTAIRHLQGRFEDELALHRRGLELDPADVPRLNDIAWVLSECLGRPEEGLAPIDEAIRRGGRSPQFSDTRGVILTRLGRFDEAIAELEEASRQKPSGTYFFHLARAAMKSGRVDLQARSCARARKAGIDPSRLEEGERTDFAAVMGP